MGTSISCIPNRDPQAVDFDTQNIKSIRWADVKRIKREEELEKQTSVVVMANQQGIQEYVQEQTPVGKNDSTEMQSPNVTVGIQVAELEYSSQQQVPRNQVPIQVKPTRPKHIRTINRLNHKSTTVIARSRKFPEPTIMPDQLVQILAADDNQGPLMQKFRNTRVGSVPLMFSALPETVDFSTSDSTILSTEDFYSSKEEEVFNQKTLSFTKHNGHNEVEEDYFSMRMSCCAEDVDSDERSDEEELDLHCEFETSSAVTLDIDAISSDASSIYGTFDDTVLTDYKCYTYCLLDDDGLETKVHVKILKDLSQAELSKAGIVPEENPVLFGVDPCLKLQRVYDHGDDLWVVSEYNVDISLKDILDGVAYPELPKLAKFYITCELIKKFSILHEQGVYLKNFGSASILLTQDGRVCAQNFLESALQKLKHQLVTGPEYVGSLQWNPLSTERQRKRDIYRLGQMIGKLLIGNEFQQWMRNGNDIEAMLRRRNVPNPMVLIISRCLRCREEMIHMDEINSIASLYFRSDDFRSGRIELQQYLNFKIIVS